MEVTKCTRCENEFSLFYRRHHCRSCGQIFCHACSEHRLLLEKEYKLMNPQRVCQWCYERLSPLQARLAGTVANRNRTNEIDTQSYSRYLNLPYSKTLGSELRKAAYSVSNLFHPSVIRDTALTLPLLQQAQGLAFLTVIKGCSLLQMYLDTYHICIIIYDILLFQLLLLLCYIFIATVGDVTPLYHYFWGCNAM